MSFFTKFVNNLVRNFTDPVGLAQDMGKAEKAANEASRTFLPSQDSNKNIPKSDRFAVADYDMNKDIKKGMYYTKPYEDKRTQAQKEKDERADARAAKEKESAKKSVVTEVAEEEETTTAPPATPVQTAQDKVTQLADTTVSAEAAGREGSDAEKDAQKDKKKGKKSGTIVTSAQGLLSTDTEGLRPSRSLIAAA